MKILAISKSCRCYETQPNRICLPSNTEYDKILRGYFQKHWKLDNKVYTLRKIEV